MTNQIQKASENIVCIKLVTKVTENNWSPIFLNTSEKYEFNKEIKSVDHLKIISLYGFSPDIYQKGLVVREGFHVYYNIPENPENAIRHKLNHFLNTKRNSEVKICVIPKGAEYWKESDNELVTNRLIIFSDKTKAEKWLDRSEIEVADEPIKCKLVVFDNNGKSFDFLGKLRNSYDYNKKLIDSEQLNIEKHQIVSGFRSIADTEKGKDELEWYLKFNKDATTVYAVIPKGAEYYKTYNERILSNELIVFKNKKDCEKYLDENRTSGLYSSLIVKTGCRVEIAKEPIICKKLVIPCEDNIWISPFINEGEENKFEDETKTIDLEIWNDKYYDMYDKNVDYKSYKIIPRGYRGYVEDANLPIINNDIVVSYAIIPEGAKYCLGNCDEIIASKMIVFSSKEKLMEYIDSVCKSEIKISNEQKIVWTTAEKESSSCAKDWATGELIPYSKLQEKSDFKEENTLFKASNEKYLLVIKKVNLYFHVFKDNKASMKLLPALIPQGAKYCLGNNNDAFTDKLIVFRNEFSLKRYLGISQVSSFSSEIRTAEKPISVFKIVRKIDNTEWEGIYQRTIHKFNDILEACEHLSLDNKSGFYAYTNQEVAIEESVDVFSHILGVEIVECIIPEGAEYRLGENKEIVSNKIIVISSKERFEEYLKNLLICVSLLNPVVK